MAIIEWNVEVSSVAWQDTGTIEIPDSELDGKTGHERQRVIDSWVEGEIGNLVSWGWSEVDTAG